MVLFGFSFRETGDIVGSHIPALLSCRAHQHTGNYMHVIMLVEMVQVLQGTQLSSAGFYCVPLGSTVF